ncbi:MAG: hypothetical protein LBD20_09320 [Spirochaetaceae bacterium]|jgi:hypothetical protein|nr:hypothetical protein [Spirochaetaceae bacterium]
MKTIGWQQKTGIFKIVIFLFVSTCLYSQVIEPFVENEQKIIEKEKPSAEQTVYMPNLSYTLISFDDVQIHNPLAGLTISCFNTLEWNKLFALSFFYSPQIINEIRPWFSGLHHTAS